MSISTCCTAKASPWCNGARIAVKPGDSFGAHHRQHRLYCLTTMVPDEDFTRLIKKRHPGSSMPPIRGS